MEEIAARADAIGRHGLGGINPDAAQIHALMSADLGGPLQFVNLLSYRDTARYPPDHELASSGLSGAQAYGRYAAVALEHVTRRGGRLTLYGDVEQVLIGPQAPWDQIAIIEYADADAFLDMVSDPAYLEGLVHRDAGLAGTTVMVTRSLMPAAAP